MNGIKFTNLELASINTSTIKKNGKLANMPNHQIIIVNQRLRIHIKDTLCVTEKNGFLDIIYYQEITRITDFNSKKL